MAVDNKGLRAYMSTCSIMHVVFLHIRVREVVVYSKKLYEEWKIYINLTIITSIFVFW